MWIKTARGSICNSGWWMRVYIIIFLIVLRCYSSAVSLLCARKLPLPGPVHLQKHGLYRLRLGGDRSDAESPTLFLVMDTAPPNNSSTFIFFRYLGPSRRIFCVQGQTLPQKSFFFKFFPPSRSHTQLFNSIVSDQDWIPAYYLLRHYVRVPHQIPHRNGSFKLFARKAAAPQMRLSFRTAHIHYWKECPFRQERSDHNSSPIYKVGCQWRWEF